MPNWLQKLLPPSSQRNRNLPMTMKQQQMMRPLAGGRQPPLEGLPNASLIYGMAASALFVVALYFLLTGSWFKGFLVLLPAVCFLGFALHFMRTNQ